MLVSIMGLVIATSFPAPFVSGGASDTVIVGTRDSQAKQWSEESLCKFINGCLDEGSCYPFGYIREEQYCGIYYISSFERFGFINQSKSEENCTYDFECESNFCFNQKCVGKIDSLIIPITEKINIIEDKINTIGNKFNNFKFNILNEKKGQLIDYKNILNNKSKEFASLNTSFLKEKGFISNFLKNLIPTKRENLNKRN